MDSYSQNQSWSSTNGSGAAGTAQNIMSMQALMAYNSEEAEKQRQWSSAEAKLARDWQKMMSDTAHQREIADLVAAGLNPILSATGGSGAGSYSAATAGGGASASGGLLSALSDTESLSSGYSTSSAKSWSNLAEGLKSLFDGISGAFNGIGEAVNGMTKGIDSILGLDDGRGLAPFDDFARKILQHENQFGGGQFRGGGAGRK